MSTQSHRQTLHFGIDHLLSERTASLRNRRIGLVTNNAATTAARPHPVASTRWALQQAGVPVTTLFSPEHGLGANAADGASVGDSRDPLTGLPIYSLYGATYRPTPTMLDGLDLLLFDIPDVGARFYTYIWTLSHVLEACAETGVPLWVLDRPNPLGGDLAVAEGPMLAEAEFSTFVGRWSMPVRHSLTVGELAQLWNAERSLGVDLTVIPVQGWSRAARWPELGLPFVPPSPSMPGYEAALLYPGTCFFEGTNVSEGRGTATPLRSVGAPWLDPHGLVDSFNGLALPGVMARAADFTPDASKYAGQACRGIMLHVTDAAALRPVAAGLHLLRCIIALHGDQFEWLPYPTAANEPGYGHFDRLVGRADVREALVALASAPDEANAQIHTWTDATGWAERVSPHLIYS